MPRRNRRIPQNEPTDFTRLTRELHDEWNRAHGRPTRADREHKQRERERAGRVARHRTAEKPDRPIGLGDARAKLASLLNR